MRKISYIILFISFTFCQSVPMLINYQAKLVDDSNDPITGTVSVTFRLYDAVEGGTQLWTEDHSSIQTNNGLISVLLGSVSPFNQNDFSGIYCFLETDVYGYGILDPRQQLTSVPYAIKAQNTVRVIDYNISSPEVDYDEGWVTFYDSTFSADVLTEFVSGEYFLSCDNGYSSGQNNVARCKASFGIAGDQDQHSTVTGGANVSYGYNDTDAGGYNPQGSFFFPVKTEYLDNQIQLTLKVLCASGEPSLGSDARVNDGKIWGK
jgi:hypothetical protein